MGMIAPRHYLLITVEGRHSGSKGTGLAWIATRMQELGVREALNLDGGNTTALVFRGQLLNKIGTLNGKLVIIRGVRSVSSVMGIGLNIVAPPAPPEEADPK
jgi:exopolysaccharide biosynthesis protein